MRANGAAKAKVGGSVGGYTKAGVILRWLLGTSTCFGAEAKCCKVLTRFEQTGLSKRI